MIHSIYTRLVLVFIAIVIASTLASFWIMATFFKDDGWRYLQSNLRETAEQVIELYPLREEVQFDSVMQRVAKKSNVRISLYDESGIQQSYVAPGTHNEVALNPEIVHTVLGGKEFAGNNDLSTSILPPDKVVLGLPFSQGQRSMGVFIQPVKNGHEFDFTEILRTGLIIVLVVGSLLILIVARYLVTPVMMLNKATKQLAQGNYRIDLKKNRKDELGTLTDSFITMANQLEQIEKMRRDFVSNVSHEIQSPLTSIRGFSKALLEDADPAKKYRFAEIIHNESNRLSRLCSNLLQLASLESEHHPFKKTIFFLDEQIRQTVVALES